MPEEDPVQGANAIAPAWRNVWAGANYTLASTMPSTVYNAAQLRKGLEQ